jgi:hypothetical protein
MRYARLIFKEPDHNKFSRLAAQNGLELVDEVRKAKPSLLAYQETLSNIDNTAEVKYIEDSLADLCYLQIAGPRGRQYTELFKGRIPFFTEDELFSSWDSAASVDDKIEAIVRIGISSYDQPPEPYVRRIREALEDSEPAVRDAGLVAFSYAPHEPLRPLIQQLRDCDPDAGVQQRARLLLDAWKSSQAE